MKFISLDISKRPPYDQQYANEIVGIVTFSGSTGKVEVRLASNIVAQIIRICKHNATVCSANNATLVGAACDEVCDLITLDDLALQDKCPECSSELDDKNRCTAQCQMIL
jgi:hypothetical protein